MDIDKGTMSSILEEMGMKARRASAALAVLSSDAKTACLNAMADALISGSRGLWFPVGSSRCEVPGGD